MSGVYDEGLLRFSFDDDWRVLKWDEHPAYTGGLSKTPGTKAVDFVGIHLDDPWFIEVKDFRGYRIENKERRSGGDLAREVAEKVRDTLAALAWACERHPLDQDGLATFLRRIVCREAKIPVVLWLEEDRPLADAQASALAEAIKRNLPWLNAKVLVMSRTSAARKPIDGLDVVSRAQQGS